VFIDRVWARLTLYTRQGWFRFQTFSIR